MKSEALLLPLLLLAGATSIDLLGRTLTLLDARGQLKGLHRAQDERYRISQDLRHQLEGVALDTARLAESGNANASDIIERLKAAGITINPPKAPDQSPR